LRSSPATATPSRRSIEPPAKLPEKLCTVSIYRDGILQRVVYPAVAYWQAEIFCETFNRLNRSTALLATFQPLLKARERDHVVRLVARPAGWKPSSPADVPPGPLEYLCTGWSGIRLAVAQRVAIGFNRKAMTSGGQYWGVVALAEGGAH
jgi:hypothetical protein